MNLQKKKISIKKDFLKYLYNFIIKRSLSRIFTKMPNKLITLIILFKTTKDNHQLIYYWNFMAEQQQKIQQKDVHESFTGLASNSIESAMESKISCRICFSSEKQGNSELITPCKCSGSLGFVHKNCYFQWIKHLYDRLQSPEEKVHMENSGFQCEICKTTIKAQFQFERALVTKDEFGYICRNSIALTITIIVFFMIAIAAFSYLVYFADLTKQQFAKANISQAFFTVIGIIVVVIFFGTGLFFFVTKYVWIEKLKISGLKTQGN